MQQVVHGARGHRPVRSPLLRGGAHDHLAVRPRHQVHVGAADDGPHRAAQHRRHPAGQPQPQQLALDRPDRGCQRLRQPGDPAGPASRGDDHRVTADHRRPAAQVRRVITARQPDAAGPAAAGQDLGHPAAHRPHPGCRGRRPERRRVPPVVHRPVAREQRAAPHVRRQERLQRPALEPIQLLGVQPQRPAEGDQPEQRGVITSVVRDRERALPAQADLLAGQLLEFGGEGGEAPDGQQVQPQQRVLPEQGLRPGASMPAATRDAPSPACGSHQDHVEPGRGRAPGDRGADDAATRDDDVSVQSARVQCARVLGARVQGARVQGASDAHD